MTKPFLDVAMDCLSDPDFVDSEIVCSRIASATNLQGISQVTPTNFNFMGVVTSARGYDLVRQQNGEHSSGSISIITRFRLQQGAAGYTADVVSWDGNQYTVVDVQPYKRFGVGFIEAICELLPLSGGVNNRS